MSTSAGYQNRLIMWRTGLEAVADKPVLGWGPGRFREATTPRNTAAFVRAEGPDKVYYDAHNVFVEHLVTSGVVGLVLLLGFTWAAARRARGPLAWFAAGVAVTWMLNPISACTGPLALLALGAACEVAPDTLRPAAPARARAGARAVGAVLAVLGLLAGGTLLWADTLLDRGVASGDLADVQQAERLLPPDATVTGIVTEALALRAEDHRSPANDRAVVESARRAVELDPTRLVWRIKLGFVEMLYGTGTQEERLDRAEASFEKGLELSRYSVAAMTALRAVADQRHDDEAVAYWTKRLCEVNVCDEPRPAGP
ncbi:MAG: O-antigen ligase family protein [Acidimicrobiales bacterium]